MVVLASEEIHDFELTRMVAELREQRDLTKANALRGNDKSAVEEDDLRWLLDKEENGGSLAAGAAKEVQAELAEVAEGVAKQRIAYGTIKNQTLRRMHKIELLEEELRLLQQEAAETPRDRREAADNQARRDATAARVTQMEQLAAEQVEYTLTLDMLIKRYAQSSAMRPGSQRPRARGVRARAVPTATMPSPLPRGCAAGSRRTRAAARIASPACARRWRASISAPTGRRWRRWPSPTRSGRRRTRARCRWS